MNNENRIDDLFDEDFLFSEPDMDNPTSFVEKVLAEDTEEVKASIPAPVPEVPVEEEEVVEQVAKAEEEIVEEEVVEEVPELPADEIVEEEKEVPEKVPLAGIPATKEDVEYANVATPAPITAPTYTIDAKAVADVVIEEIWSKIDSKRYDKPESKLQDFNKTQVITTKSRFLDNETRDKFGRNKKW